jgi:hypothetical protein
MLGESLPKGYMTLQVEVFQPDTISQVRNLSFAAKVF